MKTAVRTAQYELYNVAETLTGAGWEVLPDPARTWLEEANEFTPWDKADATGQWLCRIPDALRRQINELAQIHALSPAGCEFRFNLRNDRAKISLVGLHGAGIAEIYCGSFLSSWQVIDNRPTDIELGPPVNLPLLERLTNEHRLPYDPRLLRVLLPWSDAVRLLRFEGDTEPPRSGQVRAQRYLAYGSSITHGATGVQPSGTYAQRTAQLLGADLINLGFGGGARLEREMADYIAGRTDWDFASLELGINILTTPVAEFAERVDYFLGTICRAHPTQWVFCTDVFTCYDDFVHENRAAPFRKVVQEAVQRLGNPRLVHVAGNWLLQSVAGLTTDLVHPSPFGMQEMAQHFAAAINSRLRSESSK